MEKTEEIISEHIRKSGDLVRETLSKMIVGNKYCRICGAEKIFERQESFDGVTGKPIYLTICPQDPCGHDYHLMEHGGWMRERCKRCKKTFWVND